MLQVILNLLKKNSIDDSVFLRALNLNKSTLSDWKSGKSKSYTKHIVEIADYFNVSTDYLLGRTTDTAPAKIVFFNGDSQLKHDIISLTETLLNTLADDDSQLIQLKLYLEAIKGDE